MIQILKNSILLLCLVMVTCQCETPKEEKKLDKDCSQDACCAKESSAGNSETSEITCPECGHQETETLPTDECVIIYNCKECGTKLTPKKGDCCVFCTHGTHKCPSKQDE